VLEGVCSRSKRVHIAAETLNTEEPPTRLVYRLRIQATECDSRGLAQLAYNSKLGRGTRGGASIGASLKCFYSILIVYAMSPATAGA